MTGLWMSWVVLFRMFGLIVLLCNEMFLSSRPMDVCSVSCRSFSFHVLEPGLGRPHNSVKDEMTLLTGYSRLHHPGERNVSESVGSKPALTSDKWAHYSGPSLCHIKRVSLPLTLNSDLHHTRKFSHHPSPKS